MSRVEPTPAEGVHAATDGIEVVEPADVVRERILQGDPPPVDPPETTPAGEEPPCDRD